MPHSGDNIEFIGVIGRPHGTDGALTIVDFPPQSFNLPPGTAVSVGYSRDFVNTYHVRLYAEQGPRRRIAFAEVTTAEQAAALAERALYASSTAIANNSGERYAISDLIGCIVVRPDGSTVGTLSDVWLLPANDVWEVTTPTGGTIPLPVIDDVIVTVDIPAKRVTVNMLDGLESITHHTPDEETDA
jgi:16S rRNA processing protein RimM